MRRACALRSPSEQTKLGTHYLVDFKVTDGLHLLVCIEILLKAPESTETLPLGYDLGTTVMSVQT